MTGHAAPVLRGNQPPEFSLFGAGPYRPVILRRDHDGRAGVLDESGADADSGIPICLDFGPTPLGGRVILADDFDGNAPRETRLAGAAKYQPGVFDLIADAMRAGYRFDSFARYEFLG